MIISILHGYLLEIEVCSLGPCFGAISSLIKFKAKLTKTNWSEATLYLKFNCTHSN